MKAGLVGLIGAGLGFVAFGPLGAVVGGLAGYAGASVYGGSGGAVRENKGWKVMASAAAPVPPGLLDNWAANAKSSTVRVIFGLRNDVTGTPIVAMAKGKVYDVGTEKNGRRYFLIDPTEYNSASAGSIDLPDLDIRWKLYDNELLQLPPGA